MGSFHSRRVALLLSTILAAGIGFPAFAQTGSPHPNLDANGVDLTTGQHQLELKVASLGSGSTELPLIVYTGESDNWSNITLYKELNSGGTRYSVVLGPSYDNFILGNPQSIRGTGATLTDNWESATYETLDGTVIEFSNPLGFGGGTSNLCDSNNTNLCHLLPVTISRRNGMTVNLQWEIDSQCADVPLGEPGRDCTHTWRLSSVSNASGEITWTYAGGAVGSPSWFRRTSAVLKNGATTVGTVTYGTPSGGVYTVTTPGGKTWRITGSEAITALRKPGATSDTLTVSRDANGKANSVTRDGITTAYNYSVSGNTATMVVTDAQSHATTIVSDIAKFRPTAITDALGKTTSFSYDTLGRPTEVTYPEGNKIQYGYDGRGNLTETRRKAKPASGLPDITTTASYPASCTTPSCNQPDTTTDERGNVTNYSYDGNTGLIISVTPPAPTPGANRPQTRYSYTTTGIPPLTGVSQCQTGVAPGCIGTTDEVKVAVGYDANLNVTSMTIAAGDNSLAATTTRSWDPAGNLLAADGPLPGSEDTVTYRYDADRQRVGAISPDPDGAGSAKRRAARTTYNSIGQPTVVELGNVNGTSDSDWAAFASAQQETSAYDANGFKTSDTVTGSGGTYQVTQYSYDAVGRLDCTALRMNTATWGSLPGACSPATAGAAGPDRIARNIYDPVGRITTVQTAYGTAEQSDEVTAGYTNNGQVASVTDAEGNKTSYEYDGFDRPSITRYPITTVAAGTSSTSDYEHLTYDAASNVTSRRLRDGQTITYGYDSLNRVTSKITPGSANWDYDLVNQYDLMGRLTQTTGDGWIVNAFTYDALGRMTTEQNYVATTNRAFDLAGRQTRLSWSDGLFVDYDYNVTGELTAIRENGATSGVGVLATYSYDNLGHRTGITRGNGTTTSYGYDAVSRLSSLSQDLAGTAYDFTHGFAYNPAGQIASLTRSNDTYAWSGHYNVDRSYGTNGLNQSTSAGATSFTYDGRGNLSVSGNSVFSYTTENRMWDMSGSWRMGYEPASSLLFQVISPTQYTRFGWSGGRLISETTTTASNLARRYVPGPGTDETVVWYEGSGMNDRRWLHADERGSVVAVSDGSGNAIAVNRYDEYGIPASTNIGRFQYTGQAWLPELGMYYYKARMYSPTLGRFMQTDPIGYGEGMNLYDYVNGDPINSSDPSGLGRVCIDGHSGVNWFEYGGTTATASRCYDYNDSTNGWGSTTFYGGGDGDGNSATPPPQDHCLVTNGMPTACTPPAPTPPIRPVVKKYICDKLSSWNYDVSGAFNLAYDQRNLKVDGVKINVTNSVYREGENFLFAARDGVDAFAISLYAAGKFVSQLWEETGPSIAAWRAGLEGRLHYGWTKNQWKGWCGAK